MRRTCAPKFIAVLLSQSPFNRHCRPAVFKLFVSLKPHQCIISDSRGKIYLVLVSKSGWDNQIQPFYGLSALSRSLCEGAVRVWRLHRDGSARSAAYQRATDGSRPESDQLTYSCRKRKNGQIFELDCLSGAHRAVCHMIYYICIIRRVQCWI